MASASTWERIERRQRRGRERQARHHRPGADRAGAGMGHLASGRTAWERIRR